MRFFRESFGDRSRPRVWKRLTLVGEDGDAVRRQLHDHLDFLGSCSRQDENWLNAMECTNPRLQASTVFNLRLALHVGT